MWNENIILVVALRYHSQWIENDPAAEKSEPDEPKECESNDRKIMQ